MYGVVAQVDPDCYTEMTRLKDCLLQEYDIEKRCLEVIGLAETLQEVSAR